MKVRKKKSAEPSWLKVERIKLQSLSKRIVRDLRKRRELSHRIMKRKKIEGLAVFNKQQEAVLVQHLLAGTTSHERRYLKVVLHTILQENRKNVFKD